MSDEFIYSGDVYTYKNDEYFIVCFIDKSVTPHFSIDDLSYVNDDYIEDAGMKFFVKILKADSLGKECELPLSVFREKSVKVDRPVFEYNLRKGSSYINDHSEIIANCPVCNVPLDQFFPLDHTICSKCNGSFKGLVGELHPETSGLFKLEIISYQSAYELDHYSTGSIKTHYKQLLNFKRSPTGELAKMWACLLYLKTYKLIEIEKRVSLLYESDTSSILSKAGYVLEFSNILKLLQKYLKVFEINWDPRHGNRSSLVMFAANLLRHVDEKDLELLDSFENYVSVGNENKVFGLSDWQYKNFKMLKTDFNVEFVRERDLLIEDLFTIISNPQMGQLVNNELSRAFIEIALRHKMVDSLRGFKFISKLLVRSEEEPVVVDNH